MGLRFWAGFRSIVLLTLIVFGSSALLWACGAPKLKSLSKKTPCGMGAAPAELNGLFWLLGTPTSEHFVCTSQGGQYRIVSTLAPDSRDPLLFNDQSTGQKILVERFSGRLARPSRATFYDAQGNWIAQQGDWPQNVANIHRLSETQGLLVGFDFAELREFQWSSEQLRLNGVLSGAPIMSGKSNPSLILRRGQWTGLLDGGFDLVQFKSRTAVVNLYVGNNALESPSEFAIVDQDTGVACLNAFQTLKLTASQALVSCNPQYFGPVSGESVAVFFIEIDSSGKVSSRLLLKRNADDIQRIDLLGKNGTQDKVFVALKKTTLDDYEGRVVDAMWLDIETGGVLSDMRAIGSVSPSDVAESLVIVCQFDSSMCRAGEIAIRDADGMELRAYAPQFAVPFLSFAHDVPKP
jgi:hypothetical protein